MKKILTLIIILITNVILIFFLDFYCSYIYQKEIMKNKNLSLGETLKFYKKYFVVKTFKEYYEQIKEEKYFRNCIIYENNKKGNLLILGCSFAYGFLLDKEQSFSYKLAKYTSRNVYSHAIAGFGLKETYYILKNYSVEKKIKDPAIYNICHDS